MMENSEKSVPAGPDRAGARCAGILLTGGASRRMGRDKASIQVHAGTGTVSLAERTAGLLEAAAAPVVEVGSGRSGRWSVREDPPGGGPLAAAAAGWSALSERGWRGPVLVVATDLPRLTVGLLEWLAGHPSDRSVVPVAGDRVQPLCARYRPADLDRAVGLVAAGRRAMADLLAAVDPLVVADHDWAGPAGDPAALDDVDTPADLERLTRS